ncbi:JmjC domain-containing protein 7 [Trichinella spiralis]|uniref:JmjC domain-containing protein 7 n=1 Tax=Trichinella spiralis TaxID=6334 RepID=A0A0V1AVE7_TRISP|nr:JmjC domain-containing protein 7 [Trichinella spiralis]
MTNMTDNEDSIAEQQTKEGVARNQKASQGRKHFENCCMHTLDSFCLNLKTLLKLKKIESMYIFDVFYLVDMWIYEKPKLKIKLPPGASFVDEEQSVLHSVTFLPKRFLGKPGSSRRGHSIFYSERSVSTFMMKKLIVALKIAVWCVFVINNLMVVWMLSNDCNEKFAHLSNFTKIFNAEMRKTDTYLKALTQILENLNRCAFEKYISPDLVHFAFCNDTAMIDVKMKL